MKAVNYLGFQLMSGAGGGGGGATFFGGLSNLGNTLGDTGVVSNQLVLAGGNNITLSGSTNGAGMTVTVSAGNAGLTNINVSAGTTSNLLSALTFNNANGVTFGLDASTITASIATSLTNIRLSAGTTSNLLSAVTFSNANGITFGLDAGTVTASHNGLTSQSNQQMTLFATGNTTQSSTGTTNASSLIFAASGNGLSVGITNGSVLFSAANTIAQSNQTVGFYAVGNTTQNSSTTLDARTVSFGGRGDITVGFSNGTVQISGNQTNQQITMFATGNTTQSSTGTSNASSLIFRGDGFVSVGITNGSVVISGTQTNPVVSNAIQSVGSATNSGTNTSRFAADDHVHAGVFSVGVSTAGNTAGDTRVDVGRFVFQGGNQITLSQITGANAVNTIVISGAAPGAAAITQSIGMSTQTAGGATAGTTGYATGDDILYHFAPGSNITMSQSVNGASATLSIYGPAAGGGVTLSGYNGFANNELMAIAGGNASLWIDRLDLPCALQFDRFGLRITHSNATNSSGSATISVWVGISTRNASTLSSLHSTSFTTAITASGTAGSYASYSGVKILPVPWTTTLTAGNYWIGIVSRTTTGGANMSFGNLANSQIASTMAGYFGSATNVTNGIRLAVGVYSATTAGMPTAISITQINGNSSAFLRQPAYLFMSNIF